MKKYLKFKLTLFFSLIRFILLLVFLRMVPEWVLDAFSSLRLTLASVVLVVKPKLIAMFAYVKLKIVPKPETRRKILLCALLCIAGVTLVEEIRKAYVVNTPRDAAQLIAQYINTGDYIHFLELIVEYSDLLDKLSYDELRGLDEFINKVIAEDEYDRAFEFFIESELWNGSFRDMKARVMELNNEFHFYTPKKK